MSLKPEIIGRIILAKFLSLPMKRYEAEINKIRNDNLYQDLSRIITFKKFPKAEVSKNLNKHNLNILGRIEKERNTFFILYRTSWFAGKFRLDRNRLKNLNKIGKLKDLKENEIESIDRKLKLISTRNIITHMVLISIIEHQPEFLRTLNPLKIIPLSQVQVSNWIKNQGYQWIDNSMISRVITDTLIEIPNGTTMILKDFLPNKREVYKRYIKEILVKEEMHIKSNKIISPYTDEEIRVILRKKFGLNISRRTISYCRNQMRIAPSYRRTYNNLYPPNWINFSSYFPMTLDSVKENTPELSGIYEMSIANDNIRYPLKSTNVFYIGSSKNIRKRLKTHLGKWTKNEVINKFINEKQCFLQIFCV